MTRRILMGAICLLATSAAVNAQGVKVSGVRPENVENWYQFLGGNAFNQWAASRTDAQGSATAGIPPAEFAKLRAMVAGSVPAFQQLEADGRKLPVTRAAQAQHDMRRLRLTLAHMSKIADALPASNWPQVRKFVVDLTPGAKSPLAAAR